MEPSQANAPSSAFSRAPSAGRKTVSISKPAGNKSATITGFSGGVDINDVGQALVNAALATPGGASRGRASIRVDIGGQNNCPADVNGDGELTPADFNAWVIAFNGQLPACDQNGDGLCNPADFNAWVVNFNDGC